jgi:uncharacterized protein (TIGR03437 family)
VKRTFLKLIPALLCAGAVWAQISAEAPVRELAWQPVGGKAIDLLLAGPASGPIIDVAFSPDGGALFAVTRRGEVWTTPDLGQSWSQVRPSADALRQLPRPAGATGQVLPPQDAGAVLYQHPFDSQYSFALGKDLYRSSDRGRSWMNLTADGLGSVIGGDPSAIAFSPADPNLIVVANSRGLWRSADGGLSWSDLNLNLPNLPPAKIWSVSATASPRVLLQGIGAAGVDPAGRWLPADDERVKSWAALVAQLPAGDQARISQWPLAAPAGWSLSYRVWRAGSPVSGDLTTCASSGCDDPQQHFISAFAGSDATPNYFYAGTSDGHIWVSSDAGATWQSAMNGLAASGAPVNGIFASSRDGRVALAVVGGRGAGHVFRTTNGGLFWMDLSSNLPDAPVRAVAANAETGTIYVASEAGLFFTRGDLRNAGATTRWAKLGGNIPAAPMDDVRLDSITGTIYAAVAGHGLFRATVPDIADSIRVLNAADLSSRAAAPGGLLTVVGSPVRAARAAGVTAPVLVSSTSDSQIQVPFEAAGSTLNLALQTQAGLARVAVPLEAVSPAIFVDADGSPLVLDAGSGVLLDASRPAKAGTQILVLATGLGRVRPEWPTGLAAPLENPPATIALVAAYLNGSPLQVVSSTLAAGYIGVYMVRVDLPGIVNSGTAELTISAADKTSNKVPIFLEP